MRIKYNIEFIITSVLLVNFILGDTELDNSQIEVSDINYDLSINIVIPDEMKLQVGIRYLILQELITTEI